MSNDANLIAHARETKGSRSARKLRREGRIPASLQSSDGKPNVDLHIDGEIFEASRRHHVHLYDLDIDGAVESAVIREIQYDALGDEILHIEFKRVTRGVETEAEVTLHFVGNVREGIFNHLVDTLAIRTIPSLIPDEIEVKIDSLTIGTHLKAKDIQLPPGISLGGDPEADIAVCSAPKAEKEEGEEGEDEDGEG